MWRKWVAAVLAVACAGCVNSFWRPRARALRPGTPDSSVVVGPYVRAHLADGGTVVFQQVRITRDSIVAVAPGTGAHYPLLAASSSPRRAVPVDSVAALEVFEDRLLVGRSVVVSTAATAAAGLGTVVLLKALFGSCPTVYADTGGAAELEAEGFSYAIAPLFEHRDLDRLRARAGADGTLRLELRNEALETHFLNHAELLAVRHAPGSLVVPDQSGAPVVLSAVRRFATATDRAGRDLRSVLAEADGALFASDTATTSAATAADLYDWIDLEATHLPPGDSVAVVLRLRNSLLNTVLLYDDMLAGRDAPWFVSEGLSDVTRAAPLARWYRTTMGLSATLWGGPGEQDPGGPRAAVRLGDVGPLAFRDVALVMPRPSPDAERLRVRLRFVADNWRIDRVSLATVVERPAADRVPISRVVVPVPATGAGPSLDTAASAALAAADRRYLETRPGQRMTLEFDVPAASRSAGAETTYLLSWQGWYREWIRGAWLARPARSGPFEPGDAAVAGALARWRLERERLERAFYSSRVPVR